MPKKLIIANWKMNPATWREALRLFVATKKAAISEKTVDLIIAPPFLYLRELGSKSRGVALAAQDANASETGPHTGEISMMQVKDAKTTHVIIGHAERRAAGETDEQVRAKVASALRAGLVPIVCIGEALEIRKEGGQVGFTISQLDGALAGLDADKAASVVIAYEPVWAIGTGEVATPEDAQEVCSAIRTRLGELYSPQLADGVRVLYGGSVKAGNVAGLMEMPDVDGGLVGGASIDPDEFVALVRYRLHAVA